MIGAVAGDRAVRLPLALAEVGQHVRISPAFVPQTLPIVEIFLLAPDIDHAIYCTCPAQQSAARPRDRATVQFGLRFGGIAPAKPVIEHGLEIADGNARPGTARPGAGFQKQHVVAAVFAQTGCEYASGRATADDDIVECGGHDAGGLRGVKAQAVRAVHTPLAGHPDASSLCTRAPQTWREGLHPRPGVVEAGLVRCRRASSARSPYATAPCVLFHGDSLTTGMRITG